MITYLLFTVIYISLRRDPLPIEELLFWEPINSAPSSFRHPAVYAFIHDVGPVLCTDLMSNIIHRDNSIKKFVVFWSYYLIDK